MILPIVLSLIFFTLAALHFSWVLGGTYGFEASLPTKETGEKVMSPKKRDSAIVAMALTAFGLFYLVIGDVLTYKLPEVILQYGSWIIPVVFILRAVGELKYIGFFKRIRNTRFGKADSRFYSPLCLIIGLAGLLVALW